MIQFIAPIALIAALTMFVVMLWFGKRPPTVYAGVGAALLIPVFALKIAALVFPGPPLRVILSSSDDSGILHDTYYVVHHWQHDLSIGLFFLLLALIFWGLERARAMFFARLFLWVLPLLLLPAAVWAYYAHFGGIPRRYVDYESAYQTRNMVTNLSTLVAGIAFLVLICLIAFSLIQRITGHLSEPRDAP